MKFNKKLIIGTLALVLGFSWNVEAKEVGELSHKFPWKEVLQRKPQSIILFHGPTPIIQEHKYIPGARKVVPYSDLVLALPLLIPENGGWCDPRMENELIKDYMAINYSLDHGFDGLRLIKLSATGAEKIKLLMERFCKSKLDLHGSEILEFNPATNFNQSFWDFEKKKVHNNFFLKILSKDTVIVSTSLHYLRSKNRNLNLPIKVGPSKNVNLADPDFFEKSRPNSYQAYCFFESGGRYPNKEICKHIEAVSYKRTSDLCKSPFELLIYTRKDNIEHAKLVISQFDDNGFPKREISKVGSNTFKLKVYTDPVYFYGRLQHLLTIGYDPNMG